MYKLVLVSLTLIFGFVLAACQTAEQQPVSIEDAWIREAPPNATAMAGYMRILNHTQKESTLVTASSNDFKVIEFHQSMEKDGTYRMVRHENFRLPANGQLLLKPGDYHLMMIGPQRALKEGDVVSVTLGFTELPSISLEIPVKKAVYE